MIYIDPASGWLYGFPKPYTKRDDQSLKDWLIENGYPEKGAIAIEAGDLWVRYIGCGEELKKLNDKSDAH